MKLSLVNLVPLKEAGMGNSESLARRFKLSQLQKMLDDAFAEQDAYAGQTPSGKEFDGNAFSNMDLGGYSMNDLQQAIDLKGPTKDVPYDVVVGKMTQDEYDEYMSTVKPDRASFEKNSKYDSMNEAKIETEEEFDEIASAEQKAMAKKWDSLVTNIALKKSDPKKHTANMEAKMEYLTGLNKAGKLKKDTYTADQIENWSIHDNLPGWKLARMVLKTPKSTTEGSCGYGPDGVPGDTPGGTKGMNADDRTRGMLRMLIQKEVAKLNENENFDARMQAAGSFSDEEMGDITSRNIETPFPGTDKVSDGYKAARALIDELRYVTYKKLSDDERDAFTKEMVGHFIETTQGMAAAKAAMARKGL